MKNIVIFNGAGKRNGNTAAMIQAFSDAAAANGNQITEFYLQTMTVRGCLNCGGCKRKEKGSAEPCVQRDDMNEIYPAFRDADVIVFASPVYWWDITGTLKTAIDRLYAPVVNDSAGGPKETVLLMTSGGSPIDHMLDWYRNLDSWLHWKSLGAAMNDTDEANGSERGSGEITIDGPGGKMKRIVLLSGRYFRSLKKSRTVSRYSAGSVRTDSA